MPANEALFPTTMFPSLSPIPVSSMAAESKVQPSQSRDELLELGLVYTVMRLLLG
jgi:hypothetical protein